MQRLWPLVKHLKSIKWLELQNHRGQLIQIPENPQNQLAWHQEKKSLQSLKKYFVPSIFLYREVPSVFLYFTVFSWLSISIYQKIDFLQNNFKMQSCISAAKTLLQQKLCNYLLTTASGFNFSYCLMLAIVAWTSFESAALNRYRFIPCQSWTPATDKPAPLLSPMNVTIQGSLNCDWVVVQPISPAMTRFEDPLLQ